MKRMIAAILALMLLTGIAFAENVDAVGSLVAREGFKVITAKNKTKLSGCWLTEDAAGDTLQWSDEKNTYTVSAKSGKGLRTLYAQIIGLREWDTCTYSFDGKVQYAYNAPEIEAVKRYKTLANYVKYVTAYIEKISAVPAAKPGEKQQTYILNTNTKKFHLPQCASAGKIKAANRDQFTGSREQLIEMGYVPCKRCKP